MTKKRRTLLFRMSLIMFILAAPAVVFYSQGYRFDFQEKRIVQTGALYFKTIPHNLEIFINGKLEKETSGLTGSALINNLLPKTYEVKIEKQGYYSWQKNLEVKEKHVTEAKNIVLFPKSREFELLGQNISNFWIVKEGIITLELEDNTWELKLLELKKNIKSHLMSEKDIYSRGADFIGLELSKNPKEVYLNVGIKEQEKRLILNFDKFPPTIIEEKSTILPKNVLDSDGNYYLDSLGYIFEKDSLSKVNGSPFIISKETGYELKIFNDYFFLKENKSLHLFDKDSETFQKIFDNVNEMKISPRSKNLAVVNGSELWILALEENIGQPRREVKEKIFLTRFSEKIDNLFWLNENYLIFTFKEKIKIAEIDNRDKINIIDLIEFPNSKMFWDQASKNLYILTENNLYCLKNLLP